MTEQGVTGDGFDVRSLAITYRDRFTVGTHTHPWGQLVYGTSGVMRVVADETIWFVPPTRAIWLPPRQPHSIVMQGDVAMRTLYIAPDRATGLARATIALEVSVLLRALVLHILTLGMLDREIAEQDRLAGVLTDLIAEASPSNLRLPLPADPRALAAAHWLQANTAERRDLRAVARHAGSSLRNLQRLFTQETGMTLDAWRQRARLIHAVTCLSTGASVTEAGFACGYNSTSAFISAFKNQLGMTPRRYCARSASRETG